MRCLFCGKELALLKRLTKADEFCSDEHRRSYQKQFNELALGRLKQVQQVQQRLVAHERAMDEFGEVGLMEDSESGSEFATTAFIAEAFEPYVPQEVKCRGLWAAETPVLDPDLPDRDFEPEIPQRAIVLASPVRFKASGQPVNHFSGPRKQLLEARELNRVASLPAHRPDSNHQREVFVPAAHDVEREISIAPRSPGQAKPWRARGPGFEQLGKIDVTQGWPQLDWVPSGSEKWLRASEKSDELAAATESLASLERAVSENTVAPVPEPEQVAKPLPVTLHGVSPAAAQPWTVSAGPSRYAEPRVPVGGALPLRPLMLVGPAVAGAPAPQAKAPQPAAQPPKAPTPQPQAKAAPPAVVQPQLKPAPTPVAPPRQFNATPAPAAQPAQAKPAPPPEPKREPEAPKPAAAAPPPPPAPAPEPKKVTNKVRRDVRIIPAATRPAELEAKEKPREPVPAPAPKAAPVQAAPPAPPPIQAEAPVHLVPEKGFAALSQGVKIAIGVGALAALVLIWFLVSGGSTPKKVAVDPSVVNGYEVGAKVANLGWIENWAPPETGKRISLFKGSQQLSDYRMEFKAAIQTKSIGWMFRGMNPRNYYVAKLETLKPGSEPTVALVHYAVIDGKPEGRIETVLPFPVRQGTMYSIRFEAVRSRFTAFVQDQKIDEWHDTRIGSGAVGMYSEPGEAAQVDGIVSLTSLVPK